MTNPYFLATKLDKCLIVLGILLGAAESVVDPGVTIIIGKIFNGIQDIMGENMDGSAFLQKLQTYIYWLVGLTLYSAVINWCGYILWVSLGYNLGHNARNRLYYVFIHKSASWFDEKTSLSGIAAMHFKDIQDVEVACGITAYEIVAMSCGIVAQVAIAFYYSWAVTLVCLAGIPVLVVVGGIFSNPISRRILASKALLDIISEKASWVLTSLNTVKIFQRELFEWESVNSKLVDQRELSLRFWMLSRLQQGLCRSIVLLIFVQGFYFGSYMVKHHGLKAGNVVTVFWSCLTASSQLQLIMSHFVEWSRGTASAERLKKALAVDHEQELLDSIGLMPDIRDEMLEKFKKYGWTIGNRPTKAAESSVVASLSSKSLNSDLTSEKTIPNSKSTKWIDENHVLTPPKGSIVFSNVVFSYPSRNEIVLAGLDLEIVPGTTVFVLGHSGSGKSTLASLLSRQYPWQAGEISIDGHDIHLLSQLWIEDNIYICEQFPKMFDISLSDNVKIGSGHPEFITDDQVLAALNDSCADFVDNLPERGSTIGANDLSGGQKQRLALARARLRNAPIMLYDEVTSAMDPDLQTEVFSRILRYRDGKTTIIITHDVSVIPEGYPIFVIDNGVASRYSTLNDFMAVLRHQPAINFTGIEKVNVATKAAVECKPLIPKISAGRSVTVHRRSEPTTEISPRLEFLSVYRTISEKWAFWIGMLVNMIHGVINPIFSFFFSKLVMGILDVNAKSTTKWAMLVLACAFIDGIISVAKYVINVASESWLCSTRSMLFERVLFAERSNWSSELASYYLKLLISDTEKCAEIITLYWPGLASMIALGMVGFIWALTNGWQLTLVGSSILPAFVAINQLYKYMSTTWTKDRERRRAKVVRLMMDLTSESGFRTVKVQHLENYFQGEYSSAEGSLQSINIRLVLQVGLGYGTLKCFPYALESLLLWYGMRQIGLGTYTVQQTMTVFSLLMFTIITIDQLTSSIGSIGSGFEALSRLIEVLHKLDPATTNEDSNPLVTAKIDGEEPQWESVAFYHVGIEFKNGTSVLGSFNHRFQANELVAIVGPSGVGKSSIANMLIRIQQPTSGEIVVDSKWDLSKMSIADVRRNVSTVSQSPLDFFDGTVRENLLYGLKGIHDPRKVNLIDVCKSCGVHEFVSGLEDGYETRIKSGLLSGGQQQRLGIARALIRDPKILVLDECTSSLDAESKDMIKDLILKLHLTRNMIIILITHQMDVAEIADRIIQL